jgi:glycosyltransferase involved in cell wall biosynthesis
VFDAHELPLVDPHVTRWTKLVRLARKVLRVLTKRTQATITVSPPIGPKIQSMYGGSPPVIVRNLPMFRTIARTEKLREYFHLPKSVHVALYQGNLAPDRSLDKLVYAAHSLPENVVIVILGRGPSQEPLKRLIAEEGVESRVLMAPFVPYQELLSWTASADLGLILYNPDFSENVRMCLPNKLFEYAMVGLPVLASPLVAVNEIMDQYQFGRVAQRLDPASFGQEIGVMANDTAGLAEMRRNALVAVREHLNWEMEQRTLIELYDRLSAESVARGKQRKA